MGCQLVHDPRQSPQITVTIARSHFTEHPLYQDVDSKLCGDATDVLMNAGHTVFQLYQMPLNEADHARWLLRMTDPKCKCNRVLSLGCGVGGVEAYWKMLRPHMTFELVNISNQQLRRMVCPGKKVHANAETYRSKAKPFDLVVLCYLLGHVSVNKTLESALANLAPWGRLLVYDVFEGTQNFQETLIYATPTFKQLELFGADYNLRFHTVIEDTEGAHIPLAEFFKENNPWIALESSPGLFVFDNYQ